MQPAKSHKVLVVEDEGIIAHDIAGRLTALGHQVIGTCATAEEAIEKAGEAEIVLMDIRLDGRADGIEAATAIRERYHVPVIFLTAHADRSSLERAKAAGPFGYIVKPLAAASLQTSIEIGIYKHGMERRLEEREAWLRTTFASVADAVIVADPDGRVVLLNHTAETLTGWTQAEAQGQLISKVVQLTQDPEGEPADPAALAVLRDSVVPLGRTSKLLSRSGREMFVEGEGAPVKASGMTLGTVLTLRDVSARRWEERQLRQSQKLEAVGRLAAGVSTDYSNLLAIIRNQAEQLLRQFGEYSPARKAVEEIQQAAAAADQMNRRLAEFGTRQVSRQEVISLNGLVRRAHKLIQSVVGPEIDLTLRLDPGTARIRADGVQIEQVIMSLVIHAASVMNESGRLLLETANVEAPAEGILSSYALLALIYSGHEPEPEKLFDPSSVEDAGMALSVVHGIVAEHSGYISAQSTAGDACRIELLLPAWRSADLLPRAAAGNALSILLLDHRDTVRGQIHNFFEAHGYNVLEAADRGEAVAIGEVHEGPVDLLIADAAEADAIRADLPAVEMFRIVDRPEVAPNEIRRPFTQQALLDRVEALLKARGKLQSATSA